MSDRERIFDYIEAENPRAAVVVDEHIGKQIRQLRRFPESGRTGRIMGTRELLIQHTPYIVAYRINGSVVLILRVLHSSQEWPDAAPLSP